MVYKGLKKSVDARFRDGTIISVSRSDYNASYECLYQKHLSEGGFSFENAEGQNVVTTPDGLRLVVTPFFSLVFDELYVMHIYGEPDLNSKVVVDVGAAVGETALYFCRLGAAHVYAFEMDNDRCMMARENIARNGMQDKISLLEEPATAAKINALKYDFIKIDCEGCEYDLIPGLDLAAVSDVVMEYHSSPDPIVKTLRERGFDVGVDKEIISANRP